MPLAAVVSAAKARRAPSEGSTRAVVAVVVCLPNKDSKIERGSVSAREYISDEVRRLAARRGPEGRAEGKTVHCSKAGSGAVETLAGNVWAACL